ncbi:unannotated protein [freshwater metagenome]|uniref:Unannotated protein n=1 Tax=freshwater metagenome TaxID=449393 RepID=A0A6J7EYE9_9ZZZZ
MQAGLDQLTFDTGAKARTPQRRAVSSVPVSAHLPVAHVRIDSPLPHLDRVFDYAVPAGMDEAAQPGVRVRVRFAGRLINGLVVGRSDHTSLEASLRPLERVISPEQVLTADVDALVALVAERFAGPFWDVLRAAVPPRHARAEAASGAVGTAEPTVISRPAGDEDAWARYQRGSALYDRLVQGDVAGVRGVWSAAPAHPWTRDAAAAARAVLGRPSGGVLVVVPDAWDVTQLTAAMADCVGVTAVLTADAGPERRYREFLKVLRGGARLVIGTRSAIFAPVRDLQLIIVWNDGDDALWEPHAPYWNAREVAALRSHLSGCALLVGAPSRSAESQRWCETGWARSLTANRATVKADGPIVRALELRDDARDAAAATARIPHTAWLVAKEGLRAGPVLVQVARSGYLPVLACAGCRTPARCACAGPLSLRPGSRVAVCGWCGALAGDWACVECGGRRFRAISVGIERTAEEFGRAFPGERIIWSAGEQTKRTIPGNPAVVVATSGAEPVALGGYAAVLILDARSALQRPSLRAVEDAAHRWFSALLLARPRAHAVITADNALAPVQALVRWDAPWLAARELADRVSAGLSPATRVALLRGDHVAIEEVAAALRMSHRLLGPVGGRGIVTVDRADGAALGRELRAIAAVRSAKSGAKTPVTAMLDPRDIDA